MRLKIEVICSCEFQGKIEDLHIDDENHRHYFCPSCYLDGGLNFTHPQKVDKNPIVKYSLPRKTDG